jgi:hypothetical protein
MRIYKRQKKEKSKDLIGKISGVEGRVAGMKYPVSR